MQALEPIQIALLCCTKHLYKDTATGDVAPLNLFSYLLECIYEVCSDLPRELLCVSCPV